MGAFLFTFGRDKSKFLFHCPPIIQEVVPRVKRKEYLSLATPVVKLHIGEFAIGTSRIFPDRH